MKLKIDAIILAAGKGTRLNSKKVNKVTHYFLGKPMIVYGVELFKDIVDRTIVVVGAFSESVINTLKNYQVIFIHQKQRLGTGHAVKIACQAIKDNPPSLVLVGYGDHLMFYKKQTVRQLIKFHQQNQATISLLTTTHTNPNELAWGRIIRNKQGTIINIIEQKDANEKQRQIQEINPGFYCFNYHFLSKNIAKLQKSPVTQEYYLTDMVKMAIGMGKKVVGMQIPFEEAGIGINKYEELAESQQYYSITHHE